MWLSCVCVVCACVSVCLSVGLYVCLDTWVCIALLLSMQQITSWFEVHRDSKYTTHPGMVLCNSGIDWLAVLLCMKYTVPHYSMFLGELYHIAGSPPFE